MNIAKRSLPLSGRAVVPKPPLWLVMQWATPMPLEHGWHTAGGGLSTPPDLREERVAIDNNAFWGFGVYPLKKRAQPFALKHYFFACANSIDFLWVSYRLSINFL